MPRDCPCTAHSETKADEEPQNKFRMPELFDAVLNRQPRISLGVSGPHLGHFFCRVSAECCRGQTEKGDNNYDTEGTQRPPKMAMRAKKSSRHYLLVPYQNQFSSRPG